MLSCAAAVGNAQVLLYSFEANIPPNGPDGFFGLGATVTQDTIGATNGVSSMKYEVGVGGFVGARTETVPPILNNPPGVLSVLFDLTVVTPYTDTFANLGITVFGHAINPGGPGTFGNQVQFADEFGFAGLPAGTHAAQIDLDMSVGPYRPGESFNDIFGPVDPNDLTVASAFQIYMNKNVATPATIYVDNVRLALVPEPATIGLLTMGALGMFGRRRR
jgi:hypothetical protein